MTKRVTIAAAIALLLCSGCGKPKPKEVTSLQRKEAAALVSEAQFAASVRDFTRAEGLLTQAAALSPDYGDYWLELGRVRVKAGNRSGAKTAYQSARFAYADDAAAKERVTPQPVLGQVYVLALLGRVDEARALLAKAQKAQPENRDLRNFAETKQFDQMLASPAFKEVAL